jgi:hypothetical protein
MSDVFTSNVFRNRGVGSCVIVPTELMTYLSVVHRLWLYPPTHTLCPGSICLGIVSAVVTALASSEGERNQTQCEDLSPGRERVAVCARRARDKRPKRKLRCRGKTEAGRE